MKALGKSVRSFRPPGAIEPARGESVVRGGPVTVVRGESEKEREREAEEERENVCV